MRLLGPIVLILLRAVNRVGLDAFREQIFNITVAQVESVVEPYGITYDIWWESVALICSHLTILANTAT